MAEIMIPEDFAGQRKLLQDINAKVTVDGTASPLISFLAEKEIDLDADEIAGGKADIQEASRVLYSKQSQNSIQLRDLDMVPVMEHIRGELQYLKVFYKPNYRALGDWGATVVAPSRIDIPTNFAKQAALHAAIVAQNGTYPSTTSPLLPYLVKQHISLATDAAAVADAVIDDGKATVATAASQLATQNRAGFWDTPLTHIRLIGAVLMIMCKGNEKALGEYGFTVTITKKKAKLRTTTVKPLVTKTTTGIVNGTVLTNTGTVDIHVYKGKTTTGTPTIVHAGEVLGMTKGYSVITVVNPSSLVTAKYTVKIIN